MDPELGRFDPFLSQSDFSRGRRFQPPPLHTHRPGRKSKARRPCLPNFTANRRRTPPDRAGEGYGGRHGGSSVFFIFRPFQADPYLPPPPPPPPPFLGPLNLFPWSFFVDSSLFERYNKRKFGQRLDRVFRPPQKLLDQGKGTAVFLVSWAFR